MHPRLKFKNMYKNINHPALNKIRTDEIEMDKKQIASY